MRYVDEFRNKELSMKILARINEISPARRVNIMEVCGTHTQSFFRFGLDKLLASNIKLIAGPGCPVCVSSSGYIDCAVKLAADEEIIIVTFGDMLQVPGSKSTLEKERAKNANVTVVYSALDSLKIAQKNPGKKVVFLAVGFETTAPTVALSIISAKKEKIKNLFFFSSLKLIPPAMGYLLKDKRLAIDAFLCPGHVSAIIGLRPYQFIAKKYGIACCVAGFEPLDILEGIYMLLQQLAQAKARVANQYLRAVTKSGNKEAQKFIRRVFKTADADWRGLGRIPKSGLKLKDNFSQFDAEKQFRFKLRNPRTQEPANKCKCGDVLKGLINPKGCPLFAKICKPDNPIGPCMVSREGTCNAYYKYR
ncbi:hydrogenase formation protein HypD [bacterium]|nr:MAG: hydrogenase formation protein HypD [bacterium]